MNVSLLSGKNRKYDLIKTEASEAWLQNGTAFSYSKLMYVIIAQYALTGKVFLSNKELMNKLGKTPERTIQWGLKRLEDEGVITRIFSDAARTNRTGIEINEEKALDIIAMRPKEVEKYTRGTLVKHIKAQMPAYFKPSKARSIKKRILHEKNVLKRQELVKMLDELNTEFRAYEQHIESIINRLTAKKETQEEIDHELIIQELRANASRFGIKLPFELA